MKHSISMLFGILSLFCCLQACKDCESTPSSINTVQVQFYRNDSLQTFGSRVALEVQFEEISAIGLDTIFFDTLNTQSNFALPLSNLESTTAFTFTDSLGTIDTLQLNYFKKLIVNGPDCGFTEEYQDLSISEHTFETALIVKELLELGDEIHVEVFY